MNRPPVARITGAPSATIYQPGTFVLDALSSSDPDGDALTFNWILIDRPLGNAAPSSMGHVFQISSELAGDFAVQLVVTDSRGLSSMTDAVWHLTLNGQRCRAPLPQWGFTDYQFDTPLLNADLIRVAAAASTDVDLRLQFCAVPFPYVASQTITWCLNTDGNANTGSACGSNAGAESAVVLTRRPNGTYALTAGGVALDPCTHTSFDPATNTLRVLVGRMSLGAFSGFDYFVRSSYSGRNGAGVDLAPQSPSFSGGSLSSIAQLPAFQGLSLCSMRP